VSKIRKQIFRVLPVIAICLGSQLYSFGQVVITSADIQAGTSVFVFKQPKKFFTNQTSGAKKVQPTSPAKTSGTAGKVRPGSAAKPQSQKVAAPEPIAPEDWINEQADNAIEERKVSDSEPFLSLADGFLNSRYTFCESPQFPEAARKARQKLVKSKVLVTIGQYGGILHAKTVEGDPAFRANVYNTLGSMNFRQSYFMGKPIRIEGYVNFTQNPANTILCREASQDLEIPAAIDGGVLNEHAKTCEFPEFPADAKAAGLKTVEAKIRVVVDEQGKVIDARTMGGHPSFSEAAVKSAMKATFPRSLITSKPVQVHGILVFNQNANNEIRCGNAKTN
jgi:hypothetical protein